ncbi:MAG: hypothetical protein LBR21_01795 [Propionibacteriaceae bacterium]|jgi:hypothetical protein|nr:hypothetical protein [Propionibacteriaceae bacterium]
MQKFLTIAVTTICAAGLLTATDAEAATKPSILKVGKTYKVDLNGGKKETIKVVKYQGKYETGIKLVVNGKTLAKREHIPSPWEFAVADFIKGDKYREILLCQHPSDVSNIRCNIYRYKGGKLVQAKYKFSLAYASYDGSETSSKPNNVPAGMKVSTIKIGSGGKFTTKYGYDGMGTLKSVKLKLNAKFQIVKA